MVALGHFGDELIDIKALVDLLLTGARTEDRALVSLLVRPIHDDVLTKPRCPTSFLQGQGSSSILASMQVIMVPGSILFKGQTFF